MLLVVDCMTTNICKIKKIYKISVFLLSCEILQTDFFVFTPLVKNQHKLKTKVQICFALCVMMSRVFWKIWIDKGTTVKNSSAFYWMSYIHIYYDIIYTFLSYIFKYMTSKATLNEHNRIHSYKYIFMNVFF